MPCIAMLPDLQIHFSFVLMEPVELPHCDCDQDFSATYWQTEELNESGEARSEISIELASGKRLHSY